MPTTPGGTAYSTVETVLPMGDRAALTMPNSGSSTRLIVYTHGNGGTFDQFATLTAWVPFRQWCMDNNYAVVESAGAGNDWGGNASRQSYEQAAAWARSLLPTTSITVLARSMGGLIGYWLAVYSEFAPLVENLIVNSGTTDLIERYRVAGGEDLANMNTAYGIPGTTKDEAAFAVASVGHDPMQFPLDVWADKRVMQLWGDADTTVVPATHGQAWVLKYGSSSFETVVDVRPGGDHTGHNGSYQQVTQMAAFLMGASPTTGTGYLIRDVWVAANGMVIPVEVFA